MVADVQIRSYGDDDRGALIELWQRVLPASAPHNDAVTSLDNKLAAGDDLLLVAVDSGNGSGNGKLIGAVMGGYDGHRGWVYSLAVLPDQRRRGVGRRLLEELQRRLAARGCLKLNLQVTDDNADVVAFYRRLGFDVEARISLGKKLYGEG